MTDLIYGLADPRTGQCRYVGKTSLSLDKRCRRHISHAIGGRKQHVSAWVRSLLVKGEEPEVFLIEETEDWRSAEAFWIGYLRYVGCDLTNISLGGEGVQMNAETAAKISRTRIELGLRPSAAAQANSLATRSVRWNEPAWRATRIEHRKRTQRILWDDPVHQEKMRESRRRSWTEARSAAMVHGVAASRVANGGADVRAKLTVAQVTEIRMLRSRGLTYAQIAGQTGQKRGCIVAVCLRHTWKHLA